MNQDNQGERQDVVDQEMEERVITVFDLFDHVPDDVEECALELQMLALHGGWQTIYHYPIDGMPIWDGERSFHPLFKLVCKG